MDSEPSSLERGTRPGRARSRIETLSIGIIALFGFFVVWWVYRPGFMSLDSVVQLGEARTGKLTDFHPPILALTWRYLDKLWPGPIGMLILLDGLFWFSIAVFFRLLRLPLWVRSSALLVASFQPAVFMLLGTIWKDTMMQAALLAATSAMLLAGFRRRALGLAIAAPFMFIAIAVRHNGIGAAWPLLAIPIFGVKWFAGWRRVWQLTASLTVALVLALALRQGASLLAREIARPIQYWQMTPIFDLVGMSVQENEILIVPEAGVLSPGVTLAQLRRVYNPRDHQLLYRCHHKKCTPPLVRAGEPEQLSALATNWRRAIMAHPRAYLAHRWRVFRELLRFDAQHPELSIGVRKNRLGVPSGRSEAGAFVVDLLERAPNFPFYATWLYVLLECALLVVGALDFFKRGNPISLCFSLSGLIYLATFFFATGAPDLRYSTWTILTTLLSACALAGFEGWPAPEKNARTVKAWRLPLPWRRRAPDGTARSGPAV